MQQSIKHDPSYRVGNLSLDPTCVLEPFTRGTQDKVQSLIKHVYQAPVLCYQSRTQQWNGLTLEIYVY